MDGETMANLVPPVSEHKWKKLVFATSREARGLEPYEPTNSTSRAGSSQHKLKLELL